MEDELNTSDILSNLSYTIYIIGIGAGALFSGPATSALGRKPALLGSLAALALSHLGAALSRTALELVILRALAGLFAGAGLLAGAATLSDLWRPRQRALANLGLFGALLLGQCAGAVAGRMIVAGDGKSWRWTQAAPALAAVPLFFLGVFARETGRAAGSGRGPRAWSTLRRALRLMVRPSGALLGVWTGAAVGAVLALHGAAVAALPNAPGSNGGALEPLVPLFDDVGVGAIAAGTLVGLLAHLLHLLLVHGPLATRWATSARATAPGSTSAAAAVDEEIGNCSGGSSTSSSSSSSSARTSVVDMAIALEIPAPPASQQQTRKENPSSPPPHYRLLAALPCTLALPASLLVVGLTARPRGGAGPTYRFVPLTFAAVLAAGAALAFLAGLEYLMDAFEDDGDDGTAARVAVVAAYVGMVFAVGGGLAVGVHVGEQAVGVKVVFGGLAAGLAILGCGVWGLWFFGRRAARK